MPTAHGAPILLTGATGLVGAAAMARLSRRHQVYALVRQSPRLALPNRAISVTQDLRAPLALDQLGPPETIVHLAQSPLYRQFPAGALDVFEVNVGATQRLLDWAVRAGVRRFIYASSGSVYGDGSASFAEEAILPQGTQVDHYTISKRCGELLVQSYGDQLTVITLRFFFVYGAGQRNTMLMPRLIENVLNGHPTVLHGTDGFHLNPAHVDDTAAAIETAVTLTQSDTINVAGPDIVSLRKLCETIGAISGRAPRFEIRPDIAPQHIVGDTARMSRILGAPRTGLAQGLRGTIAANVPSTAKRAEHGV